MAGDQAQRQQGRRQRAWGSLSREEIVSSALLIAREEGIEGLTIRRLAEAVGASRMALYRHVSDKDELLDLIADEISFQALPPSLDDAATWQERLRAIAMSLRARLTSDPAFIGVLISRSVHGKGGIAMAELITETVAATRLPPGLVAHYCLIFTDVVLGRIYREMIGDPTRESRNKRLIDAALASGEAPFIARYAKELRNVRPDAVFATHIEMVITAIEGDQKAQAIDEPDSSEPCRDDP